MLGFHVHNNSAPVSFGKNDPCESWLHIYFSLKKKSVELNLYKEVLFYKLFTIQVILILTMLQFQLSFVLLGLLRVFINNTAFRVSTSEKHCRNIDLTPCPMKAEIWLTRYYSSNTNIFVGKKHHFIYQMVRECYNICIFKSITRAKRCQLHRLPPFLKTHYASYNVIVNPSFPAVLQILKC